MCTNRNIKIFNIFLKNNGAFYWKIINTRGDHFVCGIINVTLPMTISLHTFPSYTIFAVITPASHSMH